MAKSAEQFLLEDDATDVKKAKKSAEEFLLADDKAKVPDAVLPVERPAKKSIYDIMPKFNPYKDTGTYTPEFGESVKKTAKTAYGRLGEASTDMLETAIKATTAVPEKIPLIGDVVKKRKEEALDYTDLWRQRYEKATKEGLKGTAGEVVGTLAEYAPEMAATAVIPQSAILKYGSKVLGLTGEALASFARLGRTALGTMPIQLFKGKTPEEALQTTTEFLLFEGALEGIGKLGKGALGKIADRLKARRQSPLVDAADKMIGMAPRGRPDQFPLDVKLSSKADKMLETARGTELPRYTLPKTPQGPGQGRVTAYTSDMPLSEIKTKKDLRDLFYPRATPKADPAAVTPQREGVLMAKHRQERFPGREPGYRPSVVEDTGYPVRTYVRQRRTDVPGLPRVPGMIDEKRIIKVNAPPGRASDELLPKDRPTTLIEGLPEQNVITEAAVKPQPLTALDKRNVARQKKLFNFVKDSLKKEKELKKKTAEKVVGGGMDVFEGLSPFKKTVAASKVRQGLKQKANPLTESAAVKVMGDQTPTATDTAVVANSAVEASFGKGPAKLLMSFDTALRKMGEPGKQLADMFNEVEMRVARRKGYSRRVIKESVNGMSEAEISNLVDVFDVGAPAISPRVSAAHQRIGKLLDEIASEAEGTVPGFVKRDRFFPHVFEEKSGSALAKNEEFIRKQASELWDNNPDMFTSIEQAEEAVISAFKQRKTRFSNLDFARAHDMPGWTRDPKVAFTRYFDGAYRRLEEIRTYGLADKNVRQVIGFIEDNLGKGDANFAKDAFDAVVGAYKDMRYLSEVSGAIRSYQTIAKMGLAQIANVGQLSNTLIYTDTRSLIKGIKDAYKQEGKNFARDAGVLVDSVLQDVIAPSRYAKKFLELTFFTPTERINRIITANSAKHYMLDSFYKIKMNRMGQKLARRRLVELGVDVDEALKRGYLTNDELLDGAFKTTKKTQFTSKPQDLPLWANSAMGKLAFQFKSFVSQHAKLVNEAVIKEAAKGNVMPFARLLLATATLGEGIVDAKIILSALSRFKNPVEEFKKKRGSLIDDLDALVRKGDPSAILLRQIENFSQLGAVGIFSDMITSAASGREAVLSMMGGPTASDVATVLSSVAGQDYIDNPVQSIKNVVGDVAGTSVMGRGVKRLLRDEESRRRSDDWYLKRRERAKKKIRDLF